MTISLPSTITNTSCIQRDFRELTLQERVIHDYIIQTPNCDGIKFNLVSGAGLTFELWQYDDSAELICCDATRRLVEEDEFLHSLFIVALVELAEATKGGAGLIAVDGDDSQKVLLYSY
jgi:hypothetical protein